MVVLFISSLIFTLAFVSADTRLLCLEENQTVRFSECNPLIQDRTCTSATGCQFCVTRSLSGVYCPASINECNSIGASCSILDDPLSNSSDNNQTNIYFNTTLISPVDDYSVNGTSSIQFKYRVTFSTNMTQCNLLMNDVVIASNSSRITSTTNTITKIISPGSYSWKIGCIDKRGLTAFSPYRQLRVISNLSDNNQTNSTVNQTTAQFNVTLISPADNLNTSSNSVAFSYRVAPYQNITQCNLLMNDIVIASNSSRITSTTNTITKTIIAGNYTWKIKCIDKNSLSANSSSRFISILPKPLLFNVTLISPTNNISYNETANVTFVYNVSDATKALSCSLLLNNTIVASNSSRIIKGLNDITYEVAPGNYNWAIYCIDTSMNVGTSTSRSLHVEGETDNTDENSGGNGGGGGGGGGGSSIKKLTNSTNTNSTVPSSNNSLTTNVSSANQTAKNNASTSSITGASIGSTIKKNIVPIVVFLAIIAVAWLLMYFNKNKTPSPKN